MATIKMRLFAADDDSSLLAERTVQVPSDGYRQVHDHLQAFRSEHPEAQFAETVVVSLEATEADTWPRPGVVLAAGRFGSDGDLVS